MSGSSVSTAYVFLTERKSLLIGSHLLIAMLVGLIGCAGLSADSVNSEEMMKKEKNMKVTAKYCSQKWLYTTLISQLVSCVSLSHV